RSRCQVIDLKPLQPQIFQQQLMENGVEKQNDVLISALTNDLNDALDLNENELFAGTRNVVIQLVEVLIKRPKESYLYIHSDLISLLKERQEQELGLDLLLLAVKDIMYMQLDDKKTLVFLSPDNI